MASILERVKLFQTVKGLHDAGKIRLSNQEQNQIVRETEDLIRNSLRNKKAAKAPEGFEEILRKLNGADADEAYSLIVDFLKDSGDIDTDMSGDMGMGDKPRGGPMGDKPMRMDDDAGGKLFSKDDMSMGDEGAESNGIDSTPSVKPDMGGDGEMDRDMGKPGKPGEDGEKPFAGDKDKDKDDEKDKGKKPDKDKDKEKGKDDKDGDKGNDGKDDKEKDELKEARKSLVRRAQDKHRKNLEDLKNKAEDKKDFEPSAVDMGIEDDEVLQTARAKKIRVAITKDRNLVAYHEDYGPVFHASPSTRVKRDANALKRLANKVYGIAVYKGFGKAASMCGAKLLIAGVDEGIETDTATEIDPAGKGAVEGGETTDDTERAQDFDSTLTDNEVDTVEKPDVVKPNTDKTTIAKRRRSRRPVRRRADDVLDGAQTTGDEEHGKPSGDTGDDAVDVNAEDKATPSSDTSVGADDDIRAARNYRKLYQNRAAKQVTREKEAFVRKFARAVRVASSRMLLNHDEHPAKVATVDILTSDNIEFSNGERYASMDTGTAVELTELIFSEGHERFVARLLAKAADLLEKSDEYLSDVEGDLQDLAPVSVGDGLAISGKKKSRPARRSTRMRRAASNGNLGKSGGIPASNSKSLTNDGVRTAISGGTLVGRRLGRLQG